MALKRIVSHRLVKGEDLNHHGTLFAGRAAEWIIEAAFTAVAIELPADNIVCLKVDELDFLHVVRLGTVVCLESSIAYVGRSSISVYVKVTSANSPDRNLCQALLLFVHVDQDTRSQPHGLVVVPETEEEIEMYEQAKEHTLRVKKK